MRFVHHHHLARIGVVPPRILLEADLEDTPPWHAGVLVHFGGTPSRRREAVGPQGRRRRVHILICFCLGPIIVEERTPNATVEKRPLHLERLPHRLDEQLLQQFLQRQISSRELFLLDLPISEVDLPPRILGALPILPLRSDAGQSGVPNAEEVSPPRRPLQNAQIEVIDNNILWEDGDLGPGVEVVIVQDSDHDQGLAAPSVVVSEQPLDRS
mmetsp:Transcript_39287/g.126109  ORF Transcript_39287/g.126109 Transcript_39287/m.126109 type:complete len:213 (-) Transcript_39287:448-1086(-)